MGLHRTSPGRDSGRIPPNPRMPQMKMVRAVLLVLVGSSLVAPSGEAQTGIPGPNLPPGKAPEQGYVPDGWNPHEGGLLRYRVFIRFGLEPRSMPPGHEFGRVSAVSHDADGNVYVFHRGDSDPVVVFDENGRYLRSFGAGFFGNEHAIRLDREGNIWTVDNGNHQVFKFDSDGVLLREWGTKGVRGDDDRTFGSPTDIAWDSRGNAYISDGYANSRVVKLAPDGSFVKSWGTPGDGPGEFRTPHSIAIDSRDRVYVSDRENNRIQIFDTDGNLQRIWTHLGATQGIFITPNDEMWIITHRNNTENIMYDTLAGRLMKIDPETGEILGSMESPGHLLTVAPGGHIYVGSLTGNVFKWSPWEHRWPLR
jgi:DNA-binding beta-propeller fold protein YncE